MYYNYFAQTVAETGRMSSIVSVLFNDVTPQIMGRGIGGDDGVSEHGSTPGSSPRRHGDGRGTLRDRRVVPNYLNVQPVFTKKSYRNLSGVFEGFFIYFNLFHTVSQTSRNVNVFAFLDRYLMSNVWIFHKGFLKRIR